MPDVKPDKNGPAILTEWIKRLKQRENKKISQIQDELGYAIGLTGGSILYVWRNGQRPADIGQAVIVAKEIASRLKDVSRDDFLDFLSWAGHPRPAGEWDSLFARVDSPPPDDFDVFVGREGEVEEIEKALDLGRVIVMWGPGGVGKTSVARRVIQHLAPNGVPPSRFPDGILYYDFSDQHSADDAFRYIAQFYGVELTNNVSLRDAVSFALENKRALIVLDNAEEARDLRKVWRARRQCGMLIISRDQHLDLASFTPIYLDTLSPDEALTALKIWSTYDKDSSSTEVKTNDAWEEDQIGYDICEELGRLPLALRLAGLYMLHYKVNPAKFRELWRTWHLRLFDEGIHPHDSLQIMIHQCLEQAAQRSEGVREVVAVAGQLSFQPFGSEVIAAGLGIAPIIVEKRLQDLWKFSLVKQVAAERWQIVHQLLYTYAQRIDVAEDVIARLGAYYTSWVLEQNELGQNGVAALESERAHIVKVTASCLTRQTQWVQLLELSSAIGPYLNRQKYWDDYEAVEQAGLTVSRSMQYEYGESTFLYNLGHIYHRTGEWDKAIDYYHKAQFIFDKLKEYTKVAEASARLGDIYVDKGNWDSAIWFYRHSLTMAEMLDDYPGMAASYENLGNVFHRKGEWDRAIRFLSGALQIQQVLEDYRGIAATYGSLGNVYAEKKDWNKAVGFHQQALRIREALEDHHGVAATYGDLGSVWYRKGEWGEAREYYQRSLDMLTQVGDRQGIAAVYNNLGNVYGAERKWEQAIQACQESLQMKNMVKDRHGVGQEYYNLGRAYIRLGQFNSSIDSFRQALIIYAEVGADADKAQALIGIGDSYVHLGDYMQSIQAYQEALVIDDSSPELHNNLASAYLHLGWLDEAQHHFQQSVELSRRDSLISYASLGIIAQRQERQTEAQTYFETVLTISELPDAKHFYSPSEILEYRALALVCLGRPEEAVATLQEALEQRDDNDVFASTYYNLLADAPEPPKGIDEMRNLVVAALQDS